MPRFRKPQPVMLSDDHIYAIMRQLMRHAVPKPKGGWGPNKPEGMELAAVIEAYEIVWREFCERAKEDGRIDAELALIDAEYEGRE